MPLNFPNPSRSFDATKRRIRFWAYDRAMEVSFFVEANALRKLCPQMSNTEAGCLQAFDTTRKRIYKVAEKVYGQRSKRSFAYVLTAEDF